FEGPSWVSAMVALANTVADKVEYCLQYGVEIDASDWPVKGLPDVVLADKGELNGTKVEAFSQAFGVRIENAPARRGDAKGIVERYFRTVQERFKPYACGVVEDNTSRKRGGHDYRLDASLTLPEF
ncbi:transposase, partial [Pseudomonas aeruginosa]|nr:transposase [Pseudomonas aeruginosa]